MSVSHKRSSAAGKGATADTPRQMKWAGWKPVLKRIWVNSGRNNISLLSAGLYSSEIVEEGGSLRFRSLHLDLDKAY